ncbi:MAG: molybdopterin molybdotransferase MoeA [Acidobacteria bacterium]|nr:molybdopterin molybdotransferase MoeA [Acidobacteriota bacterium]
MRTWTPLPAIAVALHTSVGAVLAQDAIALRPVPHFDSSAMDGWAVAGPPPWRLSLDGELLPGRARGVVTGGVLPAGSEAVVRAEHGELRGDVLDAAAPEHGAHVRPAGEEASAGTVLVPAGTRLSPAHVAVLAIAGTDLVCVRRRPTVGFVLTGDEVVTAGIPDAGRVRDAFDPLLPMAVARLGAEALPPIRVGDDPAAIRAAVSDLRSADVVVTVGGTGRSAVDRLREAIDDTTTVFDGVAMRPGHPALCASRADGRPLLALPGNPLAAVTVLLSFLPPILDALTGAARAPATFRTAAVDLAGWTRGTSLVPCAATAAGVAPAVATRPNMLRGLAASEVLAVVPATGIAAGGRVEVLPLPW